MTIKAICFNLDDTLIREVHPAMLSCILNGKEKEHSVIQEREEAGELDYITVDHLRAELLLGPDEAVIAERFLEVAKPLENISEIISTLHSYGIKCLSIIVGPLQVAKAVASIYGFDKHYGSNYEVICGKFIGKIIKYIRAGNKVDRLKDFCQIDNIAACDCIAAGSGPTDIPVFRYYGKSIALNASDKMKSKSTHSVDTDNLLDILSYML